MHVLDFVLDVWTIISGANQLPANLLQLNALVNNTWIAVEHATSVRMYMFSFMCAVYEAELGQTALLSCLSACWAAGWHDHMSKCEVICSLVEIKEICFPKARWEVDQLAPTP